MPQVGPYGSWGSARLSNGNIVVNGYDGSTGATVNYVFNDADGQSPATALFKSPWADGNYASALATLGGATYGTHYSDNTVRVVNLDGSEGAVISNVGRGGLGADAVRNSLLAATDLGLVEIDLTNPNPATNFRVVNGSGGGFFDGVTVAPNGQTAYAEGGGHIYGFDIGSGSLTFDSGFLGSPDGVAVILSGSLAGQLIVNRNDGIVDLLDPLTNLVTEIANGGSRGDYVGFDTSNGTLFLSQSDSLVRLTLAGGTIGGGGNGVPEPATWAMMLIGVAGMGAMARTRRRTSGVKA